MIADLTCLQQLPVHVKCSNCCLWIKCTNTLITLTQTDFFGYQICVIRPTTYIKNKQNYTTCGLDTERRETDFVFVFVCLYVCVYTYAHMLQWYQNIKIHKTCQTYAPLQKYTL